MSSSNDHGANLSNWRSRPYNVFAFSHIQEILPTHPVDTSKDGIMELPSSPISFDDFEIDLSDGTKMSMEQLLKHTSTDGFLILKDGKIVYEFYDNNNTAETVHIIMSVTKSVVGIVLGILCERGIVNVDALASAYVPEISETCFKGITIRQLIDMRAGVHVDDWSHEYRAAMGWEPAHEDDKRQGLYEYLATLPPTSDPHGGPLKYLSHNTDLMGWVLERATGTPLPRLISDLLWKPMGAASEARMTVDSKGAPRGAGGLCCTNRDLARLGVLIQHNGRRGEQQIIPSSWIEDMRKNGDHEAWKESPWNRLFGTLYQGVSYRSAWIVVDDEPSLLVAMGIHGQNLFIDQKNGIVVAKTSSQNDVADPKGIRLVHEAVRAIQQYLS